MPRQVSQNSATEVELSAQQDLVLTRQTENALENTVESALLAMHHNRTKENILYKSVSKLNIENIIPNINLLKNGKYETNIDNFLINFTRNQGTDRVTFEEKGFALCHKFIYDDLQDSSIR